MSALKYLVVLSKMRNFAHPLKNLRSTRNASEGIDIKQNVHNFFGLLKGSPCSRQMGMIRVWVRAKGTSILFCA